MSQRLDNHTALVTGSTRGLGKQIALTLAKAGARVAMNYYGDKQSAEQAFTELEALGGSHCLVRADVTNEAGICKLLDEVKSKIGEVDILVLNATCEQPMMKIEDYEWEFYQRMVDFFLKSPFLLTKACIPYMRKQRWGRIVHITSEVVVGAWPEFCPYISAKSGQVGLARCNATELASDGITVNMVAPGWIPVERHQQASEEELATYLAEVPMGHFGKPEDIAEAVLYFSSEAARFVTGTSISVNGGRTVS